MRILILTLVGAIALCLSIFFYFIFFGFGINVAAHRCFSHNVVVLSNFTKALLATAMSLATAGSSLAWVGMHKKHHIFSDQEHDPNTPIKNGQRSLKGYVMAYLGLWNTYTANIKYTGAIRHDPVHKFFHYYYFLVIGIFALLMFMLGGVKAVAYCYSLPAVLCFHAASLIATWGHESPIKRDRTRDCTHDSRLVHWLTWGEGLHHQHHVSQRTMYYKGNPWYFFDLPGFLIFSFVRLRKLTTYSRK